MLTLTVFDSLLCQPGAVSQPLLVHTWSTAETSFLKIFCSFVGADIQMLHLSVVPTGTIIITIPEFFKK